MPVSSHVTTGGKQNDGKGLFELVFATIPAVLLYFVGWAYLYFYLKVFGIGISELDLDIQTILIYAYPPIKAFVASYWHLALVTIAALLISVWLARRYAPRAVKDKLAAFYKGVRGSSPITQGFQLFVVLLTLAFLAVPIVRTEAAQAADRKWVSEGVVIEAMVKEPETKEKSVWYDSYKRCASRRALDLIFADKDAYYMFCISGLDETALVFEVRREVGLVSVRFIQR